MTEPVPESLSLVQPDDAAVAVAVPAESDAQTAKLAAAEGDATAAEEAYSPTANAAQADGPPLSPTLDLNGNKHDEEKGGEEQQQQTAAAPVAVTAEPPSPARALDRPPAPVPAITEAQQQTNGAAVAPAVHAHASTTAFSGVGVGGPPALGVGGMPQQQQQRQQQPIPTRGPVSSYAPQSYHGAAGGFGGARTAKDEKPCFVCGQLGHWSRSVRPQREERKGEGEERNGDNDRSHQQQK
jgi:hypothetical protein